LTKIFLIRHAEAEGNIYRFANGQSNGLITPGGNLQIEQLKERFFNEKIDAVYSSDLNRAITTAMAIAQPRNLQINTSAKLREVAMGEWEEMSWGDLEYHFPEMLNNFNHDPANWILKDNESYIDVIARVRDFVAEVARLHDGQTIALFSHGFAIRCFLCDIMGYASNEWSKLKYCDNTAVTLLTVSDDEILVQYHSDNTHLNRSESTLEKQKWWRDEDGFDDFETENMSYQTLDKTADAAIVAKLQEEFGDLPSADTEYIAFLGERPVGILGLEKSDEDTCEIKYLFLIPELRNQSFGIQLLGKAITACRKQKIENLRIKVKPDTAIYKLCTKHGFEVLEKSDCGVVLERNIKNW